MNWLGNIFGKKPSPALESVRFDTSRYSPQGDHDGVRVWFHPEGGGIGLHFFPLTPDLPNDLHSIGQLREFYAAQLGQALALVECRTLPLDGVLSIWMIARLRDNATGVSVYLGSLTIPFRNFSFVIKMQCSENGVTGVREAVLMDKALADGTVKVQDGKLITAGWSPDDAQFDGVVPWHPLSRVRRELGLISTSVGIAASIKALPRFERLPDRE